MHTFIMLKSLFRELKKNINFFLKYANVFKKLEQLCYMPVAWHAFTVRSKGQGHRVIKYTTGVGLPVDRLLVF